MTCHDVYCHDDIREATSRGTAEAGLPGTLTRFGASRHLDYQYKDCDYDYSLFMPETIYLNALYQNICRLHVGVNFS